MPRQRMACGLYTMDSASAALRKSQKPLCGAVFLHDVHVGREQRPSSPKPSFTLALEAVARAAVVILLGAADAHHHRAADLLRQERRASPAADRRRPWSRSRRRSIRRCTTSSSGWMPMRPASAGTMNDWLCEEHVHDALAVLPVRHRRARLHAVVRVAGVHEVSSSTSFALANPASTSPYVHSCAGLAHGHAASPALSKSSCVHLMVWNFTADGAHVAVGARVGQLGMQARQRIDDGTAAARSRCLIFSSASCAVVSSTAAIGRIGAPT